MKPQSATPSVVKGHSPRFQGGIPLSPVTRMFHFFETSYEPGFIFVSKVVGNVTPRLAITRTKEELGDVAFNEATQTAGFFLTLPVASFLLNPIQSKLSGIPTKYIKMRNEDAFKKFTGQQLNRLKVAKLGKSLGVLSFIFWLKIAMPYIRNWRTIKVTGFSDYKQVIALGGKREPSPEERLKSEAARKKNVRIINSLLAAGVFCAALAMGGAGFIARNGSKIFQKGGFLNPKRLEFLSDNFALVGKNSDQVLSITKSDMPTMWFWGFPSYVGWFLGCRDKYEVIEQMSKFGTFIAGYMGMNPLMNAIMRRVDRPLLDKIRKIPGTVTTKTTRSIWTLWLKPQKTEALPFYNAVIKENALKSPELAKQYITHLNKKNGYALLGNLFVVGALPLIFNIYFTAWRYKREQAEQEKNKMTQSAALEPVTASVAKEQASVKPVLKLPPTPSPALSYSYPTGLSYPAPTRGFWPGGAGAPQNVYNGSYVS